MIASFNRKNSVLSVMTTLWLLIAHLLFVAPTVYAFRVSFSQYEITGPSEGREKKYIQLCELIDGSITIQDIGEQSSELIESSRQLGEYINQPDSPEAFTLTLADSHFGVVGAQAMDSPEMMDALISTLLALDVTTIAPTIANDFRFIREGTHTFVPDNERNRFRVTPIERLIDLVRLLQGEFTGQNLIKVLDEISRLNFRVFVPELVAIDSDSPTASVTAITASAHNNELIFHLRRNGSAPSVALVLNRQNGSTLRILGQSDVPAPFQVLEFPTQPRISPLPESPEVGQEPNDEKENDQRHLPAAPGMADDSAHPTVDSEPLAQSLSDRVKQFFRNFFGYVPNFRFSGLGLFPAGASGGGPMYLTGHPAGISENIFLIQPPATQRSAEPQATDSARQEAGHAQDTHHEPTCSDYQRDCDVRFDCCDRWWPCHRCHNSKSACGKTKLKASDTKKIKCSKCAEEQDFQQFCQKCEHKFAEYCCETCKHLTGTNDSPYHCDKCGICRINGDISFHCDTCGICLNSQLKDNHQCREGSAHAGCCVCNEDTFTECLMLSCGHRVHKKCVVNMTRAGIRSCPTCWQSFAHKLKRRPPE